MLECLELQELPIDEAQAFKSCENLLLKDSVLNEDNSSDLTDENVPGENCHDISTCHDLNCTDHSLHELVDALSNSSSPKQKPDLLEISLDDIPLTEVYEAIPNDLLEILPENIPDDKLLLLKIPEHLQESSLLNDIMDIELDQSILDEIEKTVKASEGAFVYQPDEVSSIIMEEAIEIIRRPPLQLIQQSFKFPVVKTARVENPNTSKKRKQHFQFPREDLVEFYSDEENNENSQKPPITVNDDGPSSPKKVKLEEQIIEPPIIDEKPIIAKIPDESVKTEKKKSRFVIKNCPRCDKGFKKLSMHKCRDPVKDNGPIKKLKPSEVPLPLKCDSCMSFFPNKEALDKHQADKHSRLICNVCKKVMKNVQGLRLHSAKCGIDIQPVKKFAPRYDRKK